MNRPGFIFLAAVILMCGSTTWATLSDGLVGYWSFDDASSPGRDDSGNGNNGSVHGAAWTAGRFGGALSFDGLDDLMEAPTVGLPTGNSNRTLSLWAKMETLPGHEAFFAGYGDFGSYNETYHLGTTGDRVFFSQWGDAIHGPALQLGRWHHIAVTNSGNWAALYLDGVPVYDKPITIDTPADTQFYFGKIPPPHGDIRRLEGLVDEVRIYDRALTRYEIRELSVPEPATILLLGLGLRLARRRRDD